MKTDKHIIFDLDGTLVDSKLEIMTTYQQVFSTLPPPEMPNMKTLDYGMSIRDLLGGVYSGDEEMVLKAKQLFGSMYDSSPYDHTDVYEGVMETLTLLQDAGYTLYVATNKRQAPALRILEQKKMRAFFADIIGNEAEQGIFIPKRQMIATLKQRNGFDAGYMVGDSVGDIEGGKAEGLATIAVTYGYGDSKELNSCDPDMIVDDMLALSVFLRK